MPVPLRWREISRTKSEAERTAKMNWDLPARLLRMSKISTTGRSYSKCDHYVCNDPPLLRGHASMTRTRGLWRSVWLGALSGLSAWAAYCAIEFLFSSLLFKFARPYSTFPSWHWQPTWLLVAAFFVTGIVCGAAAGLAGFFFGNPQKRGKVALAGPLTLPSAFLIHVATAWPGLDGWSWLAAAGVVFTAILVLGLRSSASYDRLGYLSSPW